MSKHSNRPALGNRYCSQDGEVCEVYCTGGGFVGCMSMRQDEKTPEDRTYTLDEFDRFFTLCEGEIDCDQAVIT